MSNIDKPDDSNIDVAAKSAAVSCVPLRDSLFRYSSVFIAFLLIAAAIYCRIRLLEVPLERDEGGFAYIGQQLLRGVVPYHSGNMKILPGIHFAYAGIMMLFGEDSAGIHTGLLVVNLISILLLYLLARKMLSVEAAVISSGIYAALSVSQSVLGVFAHATHFVILFVLAGLLTLLSGVKNNRTKNIFIGGLCLGISVLMKQHGAFFCLFALCYLAGDALKQRKSFRVILYRFYVFITALFIPYAATCLYMYVNGVFREFWFWTVTRSLDYATEFNYSDCLSSLLFYYQSTSLSIRFSWFLALIGLFMMLYLGRRFRRKWFVSFFLLFSMLSILPGFSFYPHYFVLILPALSLLSGIAFEGLPHIIGRAIGIKNARTAVVLLFLSVTLFTCYNRFDYLFTLSPYYVSRTIYGLNPFPESLEIAKYIKNNSAPGTPIAVFGSEPQIYFYSNRPSATDYMYMYPLVEQQLHATQMQQEMVREIQTAAPEFIVFVWVQTSWMVEGTNGFQFLEWTQNYLNQHYRQVGVVEMESFDGSNYFWDRDAENRIPLTESFVLVYKKSVS